MKLFEFLIPKEKQQKVTIMQSWSVTWFIKTGWSDQTKRFAKSFIKYEDAKEFDKQLNESAKFIGAWIDTRLTEN